MKVIKRIDTKWVKTLVALLCLSSFSYNGYAANTANDEITHLLNFVESSDCIYNRNGTKHSGPEARAHIQKKYNYYMDDIKTTEDFIEYSATKSMISGDKYEINCPNKATQYSQDWLLEELAVYRTQ